MFDRLNNTQFEYVLNILIEFKKSNPNKDVYLNEKSFKLASEYFLKQGSNIN